MPDFQIFCGDSWGNFPKMAPILDPVNFFLGFQPYKSLCEVLNVSTIDYNNIMSLYCLACCAVTLFVVAVICVVIITIVVVAIVVVVMK